MKNNLSDHNVNGRKGCIGGAVALTLHLQIWSACQPQEQLMHLGLLATNPHEGTCSRKSAVSIP